jgi:hypothetical protein
MIDAANQNTSQSDYQRANAVLKAEGRVTPSLLQRRMGISYASALSLMTKLNRARPSAAAPADADLILDSCTFQRLLAIWSGLRGRKNIEIEDDELHAVLLGDGVSSTVTIRSAVGRASGENRACAAVHNAVGADEEIAQALYEARRLVVVVGAAPAKLMGREIKIILCELRRRVLQSCVISFGIQYLELTEDDTLCIAVIFSS